MVMSFKQQYPEEKIWVKTVSKDSSDVRGASSPAKERTEAPASLKVGHGTVGNKRKVPNVGRVVCAFRVAKVELVKSTVAVNLGVGTASVRGKKVGILDADIYGPSVPHPSQSRLRPNRSPRRTKKLRPIQAHGLEFISFGLFIPESDPVIWRGPMLGGVLNQFLFDVKWGESGLSGGGSSPRHRGYSVVAGAECGDRWGRHCIHSPANLPCSIRRRG